MKTQLRTDTPRGTKPTIGYTFAILNAIVSGVAIYVNSQGVTLFRDSTLYTTLKNTVTGIVLLVPVLALARCRAELRGLSVRQWGWLLLLALIGGSVPYVLFFRGLQLTTPVTSSLVNHAQFLLVAVLALLFLRERVGLVVWSALVVLFVGVSLGGNLSAFRWNAGAGLLILSTIFFAAGVVLAKWLLRDLSVETVMAAKMSLGSLFLIVYIAATGRLSAVGSLSAQQWGFVLLTGLILVAFTVTAFVALRHITATAATAIPVASPLITTALVAVGSGKFVPKQLDTFGLLVMFVAVASIIMFGLRQESSARKVAVA